MVGGVEVGIRIQFAGKVNRGPLQRAWPGLRLGLAAVLSAAWIVIACLQGVCSTEDAAFGVRLLETAVDESDANLARLDEAALQQVQNCSQDLQSRLDDDLVDGQLDHFTRFQAALVAGGVRSQLELERRTNQFDELRRTLSSHVPSTVDLRSRLDRIHHWLHERILTGQYRVECSELSRTLDDGHFNCLTATILFQSLCDADGLPTEAIVTPSHVLCCVPGQPTLYVETTCPDWQSAGIAGYSQPMQEWVRDGRSLNAVQLLGKVYYNRGVAQLEARYFAQAEDLFSTAWRLDPCDRSARENLLATYNNWALAESDEGHYSIAQELVLRGLAIDPNYSPLLANDLHIHQRWIRRLCDVGEFETAAAILEEGYRRRPAAELFRLGRAAAELWAQQRQLDLLEGGL
jgi:tetratricopeptide (TPR) repeat protein